MRHLIRVTSDKWQAASGMLKNVLFALAVACHLSLATCHIAFAAFEDTGTGARPAALNGTYAAMGDDVLSLMYNPAALAQLHQREVSTEYAKLFSGLTDGSNLSQYFMGYGQPVRWGGTMAFGWKQFGLDNLYTERTLSLGYGEWITDRIAAGIAGKQLYHSFGAPSIIVDNSGNVQSGTPEFFAKNGTSKTAYSFDLGMLYRWTNRHTLGLSIQDVNEPNIALSSTDHEIVPRTVRAALAYQVTRDMKLAAGLTRRQSLANQTDTTWSGSAERWWASKESGDFALRGSLNVGSREFRQLVMGAGYRLSRFELDYSFAFNFSGVVLGDTSGTHRFSLGYRFGAPASIQPRMKKKAATASARQPDIEAWLGESAQQEAKAQTAAQAAAAAEAKSKAAPASKPGEYPGVQEQEETAQMIIGKPAATPPASHAGTPGAGIAIQVPAPSVEMIPIPTSDRREMLEKMAALVQENRPVTRLELLEKAQDMTTEYLLRTARHASADQRLAALEPLYNLLKNYAKTSEGDVVDLMSQTERLESSAREYQTLVWEGASSQDRLLALTRTLETGVDQALRSRDWDASDARDIRYKAWLDEAWKAQQQLADRAAPAHDRVDSLRRILNKALDFERQPRQPMVQIVPVAPPVPAAPAAAPIVPPAPPVVAPVVTPTAPVAAPVPAKAPVKATPQPSLKKTPKPVLEEVPATYIVKEGDTLISLAERFYGDYKRWREIYTLNQDRLGRGGVLKAGQVLIMPKKQRKSGKP